MPSCSKRLVEIALASAIALAAIEATANMERCPQLDETGYGTLATLSSPEAGEDHVWNADARRAFEAFLADADCLWDNSSEAERLHIAMRTRAWTRHLLTLGTERFGPVPQALRSLIAAARLRGAALAPSPEFSWPLVVVRVTSPYGTREDPIRPSTHGFHKGLDLAAEPGTPVRAAGYGIVLEAGERGALGQVVSIRHSSGYVTRYAHLDHIETDRAAFVTPHTTIATVGSTGRATGPHLHFELYRDGASLDPSGALPKPTVQRAVVQGGMGGERP